MCTAHYCTYYNNIVPCEVTSPTGATTRVATAVGIVMHWHLTGLSWIGTRTCIHVGTFMHESLVASSSTGNP